MAWGGSRRSGRVPASAAEEKPRLKSDSPSWFTVCQTLSQMSDEWELKE